MTKSTFAIFFLSICLSMIISCKEKIKSSKELKALEAKKPTTQLDDQIWTIFQDSKDQYWFGSNGRGIYRYDGEELKLFTTSDGLVSNTIRGIQEDHNNILYIETANGISKYDGNEFTTLKAISSLKNEWKLEPNDLWFGYDANDLFRYDGSNLYELKLPRQNLAKAFEGKMKNIPSEENGNRPYVVYGIDKDKEGNIWIGTETAGAFRYDGHSFLWFGESELSTLPDGRVPAVRSMIQDKDGYFWLSNFYSKYKPNPLMTNGYEKVKAVDFPKDIDQDKIRYFNSGLADKEGNLWMTTYGGGVWKYDGEKLTNQEINNGKEDVLLVSIFQDKDGVIWLGTNNDGVYRLEGEVFVKVDI